MKGVKEAIAAIGQKKDKFVVSYDLSAATDRLPAVLQASLLDHAIPRLGGLWWGLLVDRSYSLPRRYRSLHQSVRYAVGQPMGAYSSWGMLALTHHFLVQSSAKRAGWRGWFTEYRVLGDDIVIWNRDVSLKYLDIMRELGVEISFAKSLESCNGSFEFAKRYVCRLQDCSPLPMKEAVAALGSPDALIQLLHKFEVPLTPARVLAYLGKGYRVRGGLMKKLIHQSQFASQILLFLARPEVSSISFRSWSQWLGMVRIGEFEYPSDIRSIFDYLRAEVRTPGRMVGRIERIPGTRFSQFTHPLGSSLPEHSVKIDGAWLRNQLESIFLMVDRRMMMGLKSLTPPVIPRTGDIILLDRTFEEVLLYIAKLSTYELRKPDYSKIKVLEDRKPGDLAWWARFYKGLKSESGISA